MAVITTKYSVGDIVFHAGTTTEAKQHPCPDCDGSRKWKAISPVGGEYEFGCPRCCARYHGKDDLRIDYTAHVPSVRRLTIGSVSFNSYGDGTRYMCQETGVGSGSLYEEDRLFETEAEALAASEILAATSNATVEWVVKQYDRSLDISDYQLDNAALRKAAGVESGARSLLYNISDLFAAIEEAEDKAAILEAIAEYKEWNWDRDKRAASAMSAGTAETAQQAQGQRPASAAPVGGDAQPSSGEPS
jgi:hypothetical protein